MIKKMRSELEEIKQANEQSIREAVALGTLISKNNASNLVNEVIKRIESNIDKSVEKSVEKYVNGKIREMDRKLTEYIQQDNVWKTNAEKYRLEHTDPVVRDYEEENIQKVRNVKFIEKMKWAVGMIGAISSAVLAILYWLMENK